MDGNQIVDESFDDDVRVLNELAVGLVLVVEEGAAVDESFLGWQGGHLEDVDGEEVEVFGGDHFVFHGLLYSEVELYASDDGTEQGDDA